MIIFSLHTYVLPLTSFCNMVHVDLLVWGSTNLAQEETKNTPFLFLSACLLISMAPINLFIVRTTTTTTLSQYKVVVVDSIQPPYPLYEDNLVEMVVSELVFLSIAILFGLALVFVGYYICNLLCGLENDSSNSSTLFVEEKVKNIQK